MASQERGQTTDRRLIWGVYMVVSLSITYSAYSYFPFTFHAVCEERIFIPYLSLFWGSGRVWSFFHCVLMILIPLAILLPHAKSVRDQLISTLYSIYVALFVFSVADLAWGAETFLKWGIISPNPEWIGIQAFPYDTTSTDVHVVVILAVAIVMTNELYWSQITRRLDISDVTKVAGCFTAFWLLYVMFSPSVGYNDWGWITIIRPRSDEEIPKYFVFFMNDIVGRGLNILAVLYTRAGETRNAAPTYRSVPLRKRSGILKGFVSSHVFVVALSFTSLMLFFSSMFFIDTVAPIWIQNQTAGSVLYVSPTGKLLMCSAVAVLVLATLISTKQLRNDEYVPLRVFSQVCVIGLVLIGSKIALESRIEVIPDPTDNAFSLFVILLSLVCAILVLRPCLGPKAAEGANWRRRLHRKARGNLILTGLF